MLKNELKGSLQAPIDMRYKHIDQSEYKNQAHMDQKVYFEQKLT